MQVTFIGITYWLNAALQEPFTEGFDNVVQILLKLIPLISSYLHTKREDMHGMDQR
jgi:hypothetical protein